MFFHSFFDPGDDGFGYQGRNYYQRQEPVDNSRLYEVLGV